jgi:hypothetical protein
MVTQYPLYINTQSTTVKSNEELVRYKLWDWINGTSANGRASIYSNSLTKGVNTNRMGGNSNFRYTESYVYSEIIDLFVLFYNELVSRSILCNTQDFTDLWNKYKFDCIQKQLICNFGNTKNYDYLKNTLINDLFNNSSICGVLTASGISLMAINSNTNTFTIYPAN